MEIIYLKDENFKELVGNELCLVDFYADWCGPCKMIAPILEELKNKIKIVKVNTEKHQELSRQYGIMSIPTLIIFKNSQEQIRKIGFTNKEELESIINKYS